MSHWQILYTEEGVAYYHDAATRRSVWCAPDDWRLSADGLRYENRVTGEARANPAAAAFAQGGGGGGSDGGGGGGGGWPRRPQRGPALDAELAESVLAQMASRSGADVASLVMRFRAGEDFDVLVDEVGAM